MDTIKPPNDIECREPVIMDRTIIPSTEIDPIEYQRCKDLLHALGVASLFIIMGFIIYVVEK
jgi:hypothetical protein